jgi:hypothetical protein
MIVEMPWLQAPAPTLLAEEFPRFRDLVRLDEPANANEKFARFIERRDEIIKFWFVR